MAERVEEAVRERLARRPSCAGSDSRRASKISQRAVEHRPGRDARADVRDGAVERLLAEAVPLGDLVGHARRRRTSASCRPSTPTRRRAARGRSRSARRREARPRRGGGRSRTAARARRRSSSHVAPCSRNDAPDRRLHALARQRLAVELEHAVAVRRAPRRSRSRAAPIAASAAACARRMPASSAPRLRRAGAGRSSRGRASARRPPRAAGRRASTGKLARHDRPLDAERAHRAQRRPRRRPPSNGMPLRRSSSMPNSSSGCSSNPSSSWSSGISIALITMCRAPFRSTYRNGSPTARGTSWRSSGERTVSA